jgi:hypothetical protein
MLRPSVFAVQVDDEFDLDSLLDQHLRRLFAPENSARIDSLLAVSVWQGLVRSSSDRRLQGTPVN